MSTDGRNIIEEDEQSSCSKENNSEALPKMFLEGLDTLTNNHQRDSSSLGYDDLFEPQTDR